MLSLVSAPHRGWWPGCCSCSLSPHTRPPPGPSHTQKNQGRGLGIGRIRAVNRPSRGFAVSEKAPTRRAFHFLKVSTSAFKIKNEDTMLNSHLKTARHSKKIQMGTLVRIDHNQRVALRIFAIQTAHQL